MHKYYTEKSITTRWDKKLPSTLSQEMLKSQRRPKNHRVSYYPLIEERKLESDGKPKFISNQEVNFDTNPLSRPRKKQTNLQKKYETLYKKITSLSDRKKSITEDYKVFKKSITKNMKSLEVPDGTSEAEQKQVIKDYGGSTKLNLYTIKKAGIKYRTSSLRKLHTIKSNGLLRVGITNKQYG